MSDEYRSRSREAGRADYRDEGDNARWHNDRAEHQSYDDSHNTHRQDYSRSPQRNELDYDDGAEERGHTRDSHWDDRDGYPRREYSRAWRDGDDRHGEHGGPDRRGRSTSPRRGPGVPSDTVILEALPAGVSTEEVRNVLYDYPDMSRYPSFNVRVPPGRGRRAFVQFEHVDDAVDFVEGNYPKLALDFQGRYEGNADGTTNVYIHYARNREEPEARIQGPNWTCSVCDFSNYSTRNRCKSCGAYQADSSSYRHLLTGESDASDTPSQILVFYPLAPSVTEEVLAAGASKLELVEKAPPRQPGEPPKLKSTAPTGDTTGYGAKPGSLHRVFLMRDRDSHESFRFGFAEFWTVEDALAAMTKFKKFREFTIASAAVNVSTIHLGVFVPELREIHSAIEAHSFPPLFNPEIRVKYWEPHVYPSQKIVTEAPPAGTKAGEGDEGSEAKKSKKRKADGNLAAASAKKSAPMAGQMAFWQKRHDEIHEGKAKAEAQNDTASEANDRMSSKPSTATVGQGPIKIALGSISLPPSATQPSPQTKSPSGTPDPTLRTTRNARDAWEPSYVDREKVCCLLCVMKYKSLEDLDKHERSRNHKTAIDDGEAVKKARQRLTKRGLIHQADPPELLPDKVADAAADAAETAAQAEQYRDRAKERRQVYSQPSKPAAGPDAQRKDKKSGSTAPRPAQKESSPSPAAPKSKGSAMLAKMGWTTGQGLGANGEGRTEVIETSAYQEGVGLGAEGGKLGDAAELAQKRTTGTYAEYLSSAQDKARERYNRMN